jgi:hypothetical protein
MPDEKDQEFVEYIVKALVDHPEDVKTERTVDEMGVLITLNLHPEDMGQVIGRQGQTAKAIRTLLRVVGAKHKSRVNLKINEPEGSTRGQQPREQQGGAFGGMAVQQPSREVPAAAPVSHYDPLTDADDFKL